MARLRVGEAAALGALQGMTELLPVSSSAHVELVPWRLGWEYARLDPELRKAFEVALHAGSAAGLLIVLRHEAAAAARGLDRRRVALLAGSFLPPALVGLLAERTIERRLSTPPVMAAGLAAGALAMAAADEHGGLGHMGRGVAGRSRRRGWRAARRRPGTRRAARRREDAGALDGLALGAAQACALVPGVSRSGATLTAARLRGFARPDAAALSRHVALPVIGGATALKALRLARRGVPPELRRAMAAGTGAAFGATLLSGRLVRDDRRLWPFALYRLALAAWSVTRPWPTR